MEDIPDTTRIWGVPLGRRFFEEVHSLRSSDVIYRYQKPVLTVQGDQDRIVTLEDSRKAANLYSDARLHVIEGAGHGFKGKELEKSFDRIKNMAQQWFASSVGKAKGSHFLQVLREGRSAAAVWHLVTRCHNRGEIARAEFYMG